MNKKYTILFCLLMVIGAVTTITSSCKKDKADDNNSDTTKFANTVQIPAGTFTMGSPTSEAGRYINETQHQVTLSAFRMSKFEITNAQYAAFLNAKGIGSDGVYAAGAYPFQVLVYASSGNDDWGLHFTNNQWVPVPGYENHPIIDVTWFGAVEFASSVGGRLPTEAEWEYACRANTTAPFNTGDCLSFAQANYYWAFPYNTCTNAIISYPASTQAVGTYAANDFGLYDMHGNVLEWCSDWLGDYPTSPQTNPTGAEFNIYRIMRGGSWNHEAISCRSAFRNYYPPEFKHSVTGFRIVLAL
jgi:formylglycine-generating enzyme